MKKTDLTKAPILKSLIVLSLPIIAANVLHTIYQLIDMFWVGRLGANAVAAVSMSFPVIFVLIALGLGMSISGTILVAQYKGKNALTQVNHVSGQTFLMMFTTSVTLSVIGFFLARPALEFLGAEQAVIIDAVSYIKVLFVGIPLIFSYFVFQALMRGVGDVITPMLIVLGTVILNAILDPIFILGFGPVPAFGVTGAAIVTIMTEGLAAIVGLWLLFSGKYGIHLKLPDLKPDLKLIKKMAKLGFPATAEEMIRSVTMFFMFYLVVRFGTDVVAAFGIGVRILSFVIIPAAGLAMATTTIVGQNIGAGKIDRAEKVSRMAALYGFAIMTVLGGILILVSEPVSAFFIPGETEVIKQSALFLKIMAISFGFITVEHVMLGAIKGAGETFPAMILNTVTKVLIFLPVAYFLSAHTRLGANGIWWTYPITYSVATVLVIIWFLRGSWKEKRVTEEIESPIVVPRSPDS